MKENIIHDQLIMDKDEQPLTVKYEDLKDDDICNAVVEKVEAFNKAFIECISELDFEDEYGCDKKGLNKFVELIEDCDNLRARLDKLISDNYKNQIRNNGGDDFEDVMFFYPIKDLIQKDLIPNIK